MSGIILIAEDDKMIQKILPRMIKRSGYTGEVKVCPNSQVALATAESFEGDVDLVLMDTGLHPQGDAAFFYEVKELKPNTPIIASSGYSEDILLGSRHFEGCQLHGVLSKPFGMQDVKRVLIELSLIET